MLQDLGLLLDHQVVVRELQTGGASRSRRPSRGAHVVDSATSTMGQESGDYEDAGGADSGSEASEGQGQEAAVVKAAGPPGSAAWPKDLALQEGGGGQALLQQAEAVHGEQRSPAAAQRSRRSSGSSRRSSDTEPAFDDTGPLPPALPETAEPSAALLEGQHLPRLLLLAQGSQDLCSTHSGADSAPATATAAGLAASLAPGSVGSAGLPLSAMTDDSAHQARPLPDHPWLSQRWLQHMCSTAQRLLPFMAQRGCMSTAAWLLQLLPELGASVEQVVQVGAWRQQCTALWWVPGGSSALHSGGCLAAAVHCTLTATCWSHGCLTAMRPAAWMLHVQGTW